MSTTDFTTDEQQAIQEKGFVLRMACLPAAAIGICALSWRWPVDTPSIHVMWTCFTAYALFCWTSCFHETAHQTLTPWRWLDITIGRILGTLMYVPYTVYRETHIRHHAYLNRPNDWELWPYSNPTYSIMFRRVFVILDICFGFLVAPFIYGRIFFHTDSPLKNAGVRSTISYEYLGIVLFWSFIFRSSSYTGGWSWYMQAWLVPHWIAGVLQTMRKLTEHLGMASYDPMLGTRTVVGRNWLTRLGSFMNFDIFIHGPHHRHPKLAQNLLKGKMEEYLSENPETKYPVYSSYLQATMAMMSYLVVNPGIGMNVGAAPPDEAKLRDINNFPADVTREVHQQVQEIIQEAAKF